MIAPRPKAPQNNRRDEQRPSPAGRGHFLEKYGFKFESMPGGPAIALETVRPNRQASSAAGPKDARRDDRTSPEMIRHRRVAHHQAREGIVPRGDAAVVPRGENRHGYPRYPLNQLRNGLRLKNGRDVPVL